MYYCMRMQVEVFWDLGKREKAHSASTSAKNWAVASIICGFGIMAAGIFISTLVVFANRNKNYSWVYLDIDINLCDDTSTILF